MLGESSHQIRLRSRYPYQEYPQPFCKAIIYLNTRIPTEMNALEHCREAVLAPSGTCMQGNPTLPHSPDDCDSSRDIWHPTEPCTLTKQIDRHIRATNRLKSKLEVTPTFSHSVPVAWLNELIVAFLYLNIPGQ